MFITPNGLHFHHENVLRQDPLPKPNHANIAEVPRLCGIIVVPKALPNPIMTDRELAMEIPRGQRFVQAPQPDRAFRSDPFGRGKVSNSARRSTPRGHIMSNFSEKILAVMLENHPLPYSKVGIRKNSIQFPMETEFREFLPELEEHSEISEHIRGFNVTIVTSANTRDETIPLWSGFSPFSI
uniref:Ribosomal protein L5 n=1 Tax=Podocarpus macrophyllus TaxID=58043 RepID=A0A6M3X671_9CONI|nr:ribosomal protein L5 [Podocarpus macrophyllus]QXE44214.1 ribosomal protein L5 [Podocarpus macrophyllus]BDC46314.1 ribosomal protein L5 [Nageia nagi]